MNSNEQQFKKLLTNSTKQFNALLHFDILVQPQKIDDHNLQLYSCHNHYLRYCWLKYTVLIINIIISLMTIFGNILVIMAFFLDRRIRHPSNLFICSLAVSDCLIGVFSMPMLTSYIFNNQKWPFNRFLCNVWLSLDYSLCLTSIYTVLSITVDRFCSVKFPAKYTKYRTKRNILITIYCSWIIPALIFFSSTFAYPAITNLENFNVETGQCDVRWKENKLFNVLLTVFYFWLTLFIMIILYIKIYLVARNLARRSRKTANFVTSLVGRSRNVIADTLDSLSVQHDQKKILETTTDSTKENSCKTKPEEIVSEDSTNDNIRTLKFNNSSIVRHNGCKRARKSLRTITFILGAFIICWTPWHIIVILSNYCERCNHSSFYVHLYLFVYYMCYVNSPINPICYAMANQQFQHAFSRFMRLDFRSI